jgi:tetratricopeptide (TPR) repeat protein
MSSRGRPFENLAIARRMTTALMVVGCIVAGCLVAGCDTLDWRDSVSRNVAEGNELLASGDFDNALAAYREAQIDAPDDPRVHFNIGDVMHRQGVHEEAGESFEKAMAGRDKTLRSMAAYNLGNNYVKENKLPEAAESYQRALELSPGDMDAKFNLELVQHMLSQAAEQAENQEQQEAEKRVSEWARRRARRAESLVIEGRYREADRIMQHTIEAEPAAESRYGDFAARLGDLTSALEASP